MARAIQNRFRRTTMKRPRSVSAERPAMKVTTMAARIARPYGSWKSPLTSEVVTKSGIRLGGLAFGRDERTFWVEGRPSEGGRNLIVRDDGLELTPKEMNVRTRVHEYGGGAWKILPSRNLVLFCDFKSQRMYSQDLDGSLPQPLTPDIEGAKLRFADFEYDERRNRVICVIEDHRGEGKEPVNSLAAVDLDGACAEPVPLVQGADFYAGPALNASCDKLAFVCWNHPSMPWDRTCIMMVDLDAKNGLPTSQPTLVAGGPGMDQAPQQPQWTPDGRLVYISDEESGWWNLFTRDFEKSATASLCPKEGCEFGGPPWALGMSSYKVRRPSDQRKRAMPRLSEIQLTLSLPSLSLSLSLSVALALSLSCSQNQNQILSDDKILCSYSDVTASGKTLAYLTPSTSALIKVDLPYQSFGSVDIRPDGRLGVLGGSTSKYSEIAVQTEDLSEWKALKSASTLTVDPGYLSEPQVIKYPSKAGRFAYMY